MTITVGALVQMFLEPSMLIVDLFSLGDGNSVWTGVASALPPLYETSEVRSIDTPSQADHITINID